jgi:hypothetical protein
MNDKWGTWHVTFDWTMKDGKLARSTGTVKAHTRAYAVSEAKSRWGSRIKVVSAVRIG